MNDDFSRAMRDDSRGFAAKYATARTIGVMPVRTVAGIRPVTWIAAVMNFRPIADTLTFRRTPMAMFSMTS